MIPDTLYMTVPCLLLLGLFCLNWWRVMRLEKIVGQMRDEIEDEDDWMEDIMNEEEEDY